MNKIKKYFKNYFETSSLFKIITDVLVGVLFLMLLIPTTRAYILRAVLFPPKVAKESVLPKMQADDYQLVLEDLEGNTINLSSYSDKTIFISFWATWCPPCIAEMPSIQKLTDRFGEKLPTFLITSEDKAKVITFLKEHNYNLPVYFQKSQAKGILNINSYPTSFLISSNSEVIVHKTGAANWNSASFREKLNAILKNPN
jgi:thiol-disulfide isomerase/thioredoxin